jgi:hypothetical protein
MGNPWVQFGINARRARPGLGLVGLADAEAMDAREFALQVSLLDPPIFTGEHPDVERETGVKRLRQFLHQRFDQRRCLGCQKELAAAMMLGRCLAAAGAAPGEKERMRTAFTRLVDIAAQSQSPSHPPRSECKRCGVEIRAPGTDAEREALVALASAEMPNMGMRALVDDPDNQTLLIVQTTQQPGSSHGRALALPGPLILLAQATP